MNANDDTRAAMITLSLPWPPSINDYYGKRTVFKGHRCGACKRGKSPFVQVYIRQPGLVYRERVAVNVDRLTEDDLPLKGHLAVAVLLRPPNNIKRDEDNIFKSLWDALTHAGLWEDDSQIKRKYLDVGDVLRPRVESTWQFQNGMDRSLKNSLKRSAAGDAEVLLSAAHGKPLLAVAVDDFDSQLEILTLEMQRMNERITALELQAANVARQLAARAADTQV